MKQPDDACSSLEERALDVLEGRAPEFAEHARDCAPCGEVLERERRLVAALEALPAVPEFHVPTPTLPAGRVLRRPALFRGVATVAAAALLVAVGLTLSQTEQAPGDALTGTSTATAGATAAGSLEDVTTLLDDDLLALTMGHEAVVMQRPTER